MTPSPEHIEFDQICSEVDDFEPLPSIATAILEPEEETPEESSVEGQILAALVSPGY
jgi:hypothetical protein